MEHIEFRDKLKLLDGFEKVAFNEPMLSAQKTKDFSDLLKFVGDQEVVITYKFDGLVCGSE